MLQERKFREQQYSVWMKALKLMMAQHRGKMAVKEGKLQERKHQLQRGEPWIATY